MKEFGKIADYYAFAYPMREAQKQAFDFLDDSIQKGYKIFCINAPTGSGKSSIGVTFANWANHIGNFPILDSSGQSLYTEKGAYYITPQNLLQDQIITDKKNGLFTTSIDSIRSSIHFPCSDTSGTCATGSLLGCESKDDFKCPYVKHKIKFLRSKVSLTNTSFLLYEHIHAEKLPPKNALIVDEAHRMENELASAHELNFIVYKDHVNTDLIPFEGDKISFVAWMKENYIPYVNDMIKLYTNDINNVRSDILESTKKLLAFEKRKKTLETIFAELETHSNSFIQYETDVSERSINYVVKPLNVQRYASSFYTQKAHYVLFMSATLENLKNFSAYSGIPEEEIAYLDLSSNFPLENRPVFFNGHIGSMGNKNKQYTLPKLLQECKEILDNHPTEKGIIHAHSYALGAELYNYLSKTKHRGRLVYNPESSLRDQLFLEHANSKLPTVIIGPSFTEGFDFKDDLARWQIIPKIPYAYLGDPFVKAKAEENWEWYDWETVKTIIQATGRVVRHEKDWGVTYIIDSDLRQLVKRSGYLFPKWWSESLKVV